MLQILVQCVCVIKNICVIDYGWNIGMEYLECFNVNTCLHTSLIVYSFGASVYRMDCCDGIIVAYLMILWTQAGQQKGIFCLTQKRPPINDLAQSLPAHIKQESCQWTSPQATPWSEGPIGWEHRWQATAKYSS